MEQEEIEYFATGHPLVEALFGFLRDGPYGRNGVRYLEERGPVEGAGLEVLFHVSPAGAGGHPVRARACRRGSSRASSTAGWCSVAVVTGAEGKPKVEPTLHEALKKPGRSLKGEEVLQGFPEIEDFVDPAVVLAMKDASAQVTQLQKKAKAAIEAERDAALARMKLALSHQGLSEKTVTAQLRGGVGPLRRVDRRAGEAPGGAGFGLRVSDQSVVKYRGKTPAELREAMKHPPRLLGVPRRFRSALTRGLAEDLARRFPSMDALLSELAAAGRTSRRAIALAAVVLLVGGAGWAAVSSRRAEVEVVAVAKDLREGQVVTRDLMIVRSVPKDVVTPSVIRPDSIQYVVNQPLQYAVNAGDLLLWTHFEQRAETLER